MPVLCCKNDRSKKRDEVGCLAMKFLVDAQLPRRLSLFLQELGYEAIHTTDLPNKNLSTDKEITELSLNQKLIVISKDSDFYVSFLQKAEPYKLIYLTVGNMTTNEIISLFSNNLKLIVEQIAENHVIDISSKNIITII